MTAHRNSWKRVPFTGGEPIPYTASFAEADAQRIAKGLVPEVMEDKWFAYFEAPHLFLHRSWTGEPVYRVELRADADGGAEIVEALCTREVLQQSSPDTEAKLLDFLVSNLLLGQSKPFPIPPGGSPGITQHAIAGTAYRETGSPPRRRWWQIWK